jgi:hypothetical protein
MIAIQPMRFQVMSKSMKALVLAGFLSIAAVSAAHAGGVPGGVVGQSQGQNGGTHTQGGNGGANGGDVHK